MSTETTTMKRLIHIAVFTFMPVFAAAQSPDSVSFSSGDKRVTLVELYTSEGCSSCPPADRWLSEFRDDERLWTDIVPVALHVDYWDYIGWKDRFADPRFSQRQRRYRSSGAAGAVYTPGLFADGMEWAGWFRNRELKIRQEPAGNLDVVVDGGAAAMMFSPPPNSDNKFGVSVAVLGMGLETDVRAGENRGRKLRHDFVTLHLQSVPMQPLGNAFTARVEIPEIETDADRLALAVWVTTPDGIEVLQSTGGYL